MIDLARRGLLLLRSNPRLFLRRIGMLARDPVRTARAMVMARQYWERIERSYEEWVQTEEPLRPSEAIPDSGLILSVIMPVHDIEGWMLDAAIRSVIEQTYPRWELCIADDASTEPHVRPLLEEYARRDSRIRLVFREIAGHISAASNTALSIATGEFVLLLDHDDHLAPDALQCVAEVVRDNPDVDFIYSDEDKIDLAGRRSQPFFKPAWSPTLLTSCNYITHLAAMRRSLVMEVGGFRDQVVGSQDHDLFLRVTERSRIIAHIPRVLYSWRMAEGSTARASSAKPYAIDAARRTLTDMIQRRQLPARVDEMHLNGIFAIRRALSRPAGLSVIVVGTGRDWQTLLTWDDIQICDVHFLDRSQPLRGNVHVVRHIEDLTGEYFLWVDASSRPARPGSIVTLLETLQDDQVALAGGATVLHDGTTLQAGLIIGEQGQPVYGYGGLPVLPLPNFYLNLKDLPREVSAVYAGCCAMRRATWESVGGWNAALPPDLALCDLCLRCRERGQRIVYSPLTRFTRRKNLPSVSAVKDLSWSWKEYEDPFWNPNMHPESPDGTPFRHGARLPPAIRLATPQQVPVRSLGSR